MSSELNLVILDQFTTVAEAEMVKELLEQEGIMAAVSGETDPLAIVSGAQPVVVLVNEADLSRAQELYQAFFSGEAEPLDEPQSDL